MNLFELFVKIGLDDQASNKLSNLSSKLGNGLKTAAKVGTAAVATVTAAAGAMTTAFIKGTSEVAQYGDNIDKMSQKLGLSAEAYQKWDFVIGQSGADIDSMSVGLKTLTNQIDQAKNGSADATDKFAKLGISMEDLNSMSREEVFEAAIKGFQGMADSTERAALANDLFGRSGQELTPLFNTSIEQTEALLAKTEEYGMVMSNDAVKASAAFQDSLDVLTRSTSGLKNNLMANFLPSITSVMDGLALIFSGNDSGIAKITEGINDFADNLIDIIPKIFELGEGILSSLATAILDNLPTLTSTASKVILQLFDGIVSALPQLAEAAVDIVKSLAQGLSDNLDTIMDSAVDLIKVLTNGILDLLPEIIKLGLDLIVSLATGIAENLDTLIPTIIDVVLQIVEILTNQETLTQLLGAAFTIITELAWGLVENIDKLIDATFLLIDGMIDFLLRPENLVMLIETAIELVVAIGTGIVKAIPRLLVSLGSLINSIFVNFATADWKSIGTNIVDGLKNGISKAWENLKNWFKNLFGDLGDIAKKILGIASPSKVFKKIGGFTAEGFGVGFEDEFDRVKKDMERAMTFDDVSIGINSSIKRADASGLYGANMGGVSVVQNIYSEAKTAADLMQEALYQQERAVMLGV